MTDQTTIGQSAVGASQVQLQEGEDYVCPTCGSEVRVRHPGDPAKQEQHQPLTCTCGTRMEREHA